MKQKTFLLILFSISCLWSFAQLSGGVRAGGNFTNILGPNSKDFKFKPGFHAGAYMEYDFATHLSFQAEGVYSVKGYRQKYTRTTNIMISTISEDVNVLYSLSYIDVPLILNINFGSMGSYIGFGPQVSFLVSAKWDGENSTTTTFTNPPRSVSTTSTVSGVGTDGLNPVDFGVIFGLGSKFENGMEYCLRGGYGLTNVFDPHQAATSEVYHNLVLSATIGYAFGQTSGSYVSHKGYSKKKKRRRH